MAHFFKRHLHDEYCQAQNEMRQIPVVHEKLKRLLHDEKSEAQLRIMTKMGTPL